MVQVIRDATAADAAAMLAIYAPVVRDTAISFEYEPPSLAEFGQRLASVLPDWPWLVLELAGEVKGYAYAKTWRERAAYQWTVETTIYLAESARGHGLGKVLYGRLLQDLTGLGYRLAIGGLTLPNPASERLHAALGFRLVGHYHKCGFKYGRWWDVAFYERELAPRVDSDPRPPRRYGGRA